MKVTLEQMAQPFLLRIIEDDKEKIKEKTTQVWGTVKDKLEMDGFRPGKVPQNIAEAKIGFKDLYAGYINELIVSSVKRAEESEGVTIVDIQQIYPEQLGKDGIVMQAVTYLKPRVTVDYSNLTATKKASTVSDETVQLQLDQMREAHALQVPVTDRGLNFGDTAVLSYVGSIDGVPFKNGTASRQRIVLTERTFVPGFAEQILGMMVDENRTIEVTFPEDHGAGSNNAEARKLAGKKTAFDITLHEISRKDLPELDDDFAQTSGFDSYADLVAATKADLVKRQEELNRSETETALVTQLLGRAQIDPLPQTMIKRYLDQMLQQQLNQIGMNEDDFFQKSNMTRDQFDGTYYHIAKRDLKVQLILDYIAYKEGFSVADDEYTDYVRSEAKRLQLTEQNLQEMVTRDQVDSRIKMRKAYDYLLANAQYVEPKEELDDGSDVEAEPID